MRFFAALSTLALVVATPFVAKADTFTITGNAQTIVFDLPASPTPDSYVPGVGFLFNNVSIMDNGIPLSTDVGFGNVDQGGYPDLFVGNGESISMSTVAGVPTGIITGGNPSYGFFLGDMLYSGTEANPTFLLGSFPILNVENPSLGGTPGGFYTLTISQTSAVTPEPSSLLLLGSGLLGLAGAARRRFV